jgi:hypothetical protein
MYRLMRELNPVFRGQASDSGQVHGALRQSSHGRGRELRIGGKPWNAIQQDHNGGAGLD